MSDMLHDGDDAECKTVVYRAAHFLIMTTRVTCETCFMVARAIPRGGGRRRRNAQPMNQARGVVLGFVTAPHEVRSGVQWKRQHHTLQCPRARILAGCPPNAAHPPDPKRLSDLACRPLRLPCQLRSFLPRSPP